MLVFNENMLIIHLDKNVNKIYYSRVKVSVNVLLFCFLSDKNYFHHHKMRFLFFFFFGLESTSKFILCTL